MDIKFTLDTENYEYYEQLLDFMEINDYSIKQFFNELVADKAKSLKQGAKRDPDKDFIDLYIYDLALKYLVGLNKQKQGVNPASVVSDIDYLNKAMLTVLPVLAKDSNIVKTMLSNPSLYDYHNCLNILEPLLVNL